ncbi:MAG: alanine--tRNA ligase, partial [Candidatus Dormibacteraeota bacterium]|nr:alanine--tRNA ligase [Candidatus Dormibacteraeota bacterium]
MHGSEIRRRFLQFFQERDHLLLESAPLLPEDDPSTLFISAGMQPLQPFYRGLRRPPAPRLVSCQRVVRTQDIDEVGKTDRHGTFFEMLGNFAPTGDYFKETAIALAWEFCLDRERGLGMDPERLWVTTHPSDEEARHLWRDQGVPESRMVEAEENWWSLGVGPAGTDSELWYDRGPAYACGEEVCFPDHKEDCVRHLEFWNLVFPSFDEQPDGTRVPLPRPGIDTGMGLERVTSLIQDVPSIFDTDLVRPMMEWVRANAAQPGVAVERVLADHLRSMTFIVADGVLPSNEGRGYVLRRLIRHAALEARKARFRAPLADGVRLVVEGLKDQYPYLVERECDVRAAIAAEDEQFGRTLGRGLELFEKIAAGATDRTLPGDQVFRLHDTEGFPVELTRELALERGLRVDEDGFERAMAEQRERSRKAIVHNWADLRALPRSEFLGYERLEVDAEVVLLRAEGREVDEAPEGDEVEVYLDQTPFYGESGGQTGDTGTLTGPEGVLRVEDTKHPLGEVTAHLGRVTVGRLRRGDRVRAQVDAERRRQIMRHHSTTHLLNRALEEVLGRRNLQRGSWVGPDHTTFDFPLDRPLAEDERQRLLRRIDEQIRAALPRRVRLLPREEALATGATHLF